jgi:predicted dehydrogenase
MGTMRWDNTTGILEVFSTGKKEWDTYQPPKGFERNDLFIAEMKHFISVVQKKELPLCDLQDGKRALEMALAAHQSANQEKMVML